MKRDSIRFAAKFLLVLAPPLVLLLADLVLPYDQFTFRVWEALIVKRHPDMLPGPFYPNQTLDKVEEGDLAAHSRYAVPKVNTWITDRYGFRNTPSACSEFPVVIIGDSTVAGAALDQKQTLPATLERESGVCVYNFGFNSPDEFLRKFRFIAPWPKTVVFTIIEHGMTVPRTITDDTLASPGLWDRFHWGLITLRPFERFATMWDRVCQPNTFAVLQNRGARLLADELGRALTGRKPVDVQQEVVDPPVVLFDHGDADNVDVPRDGILQAADWVERIDRIFRSLGMSLIVMPMPNKETIAYELLPSRKPSDFLTKLLSEIDARGIRTVNLVPPFTEEYRRRGLPYHTDDSHWNARGVDIAVQMLMDELKRPTNDQSRLSVSQ